MTIPLRPSSAHIWVHCPGFGHLMQRTPAGEAPHSTDAAREGTCAAWVAEMVLTHQAPDTWSLVGQQHANGWVVDQDMAGFIHDYVELLTERYGTHPRAEVTMSLTPWLSGTPDGHAVWEHAPREWTLAVDDLKYGHEIVEPWENDQVTVYAGMIAKNTQLPVGHQFTRVMIGIYQPRPYHPLGPHRVWEPSVRELAERIATLVEAGERAQYPDAPCVAGAHCRRCDVAHRCAAVAHEAYRCVSTMANQHDRQMNADEMSKELDFLDLAERIVKGRRDAVRAEAEARIARGETIPGWTTERGKGKRRFRFDADTVKLLTGIDPVEQKLVTPKELERRGASKSVVAHLTETPSTAAKLTRYSHRVVGAKFGDVKS